MVKLIQCFLLIVILYTGFAGTVDYQGKMKLLIAPKLHQGDTVGLVSSAAKAGDVDQAIQRLQALGLRVVLGRYVRGHYGYFAATDQQRAQDLNAMFANPKIKAIFEIRGGWGSSRMLRYVNFALIKRHPKILVGYSDITSLLLAIHKKTGLVTFHGPMPATPWPDFTVQQLKRVLFNPKPPTLSNPADEIKPSIDNIKQHYPITTIVPGKVRGVLMGGNLTTLTSLLGTKNEPDWHNKILFIEDVGEKGYRIDRMLAQLKQAGVLKQLKGFVFGTCTNCNFVGGFSLQALLNRYIVPLRIPAYMGAMIGHQHTMLTVPEGALVELDATRGSITVLQSVVQ